MIDANISYNQIYFSFEWTWIKDKKIIHKGNDYYGMLMIADKDGVPIKIYGYESITNEKE